MIGYVIISIQIDYISGKLHKEEESELALRFKSGSSK